MIRLTREETQGSGERHRLSYSVLLTLGISRAADSFEKRKSLAMNEPTTTPRLDAIVMPPCADCGGLVGKDHGPPDGWQLEDGRTVCHACCVADTKQVLTGYRRYLCERCGGTGQQPTGSWDGTAYASTAGMCETCSGEGYLGPIRPSA